MKNDCIIFAGDSITDAGRSYNTYLGDEKALGMGYVGLINAYTTALYPKKQLKIINQGINGNRIIDLEKRWSEILQLNPDWITIMIGINDVWRQFDGIFTQRKMVTPQLFEETYNQLVTRSIAAGAKIILMSSFMVEANKNDAMKKRVREYNEITKKIAKKHQLLYIDIQEKIDEFTTVQSSYALSADRVHVSLAGHLLIAKAWLEAVDIA